MNTMASQSLRGVWDHRSGGPREAMGHSVGAPKVSKFAYLSTISHFKRHRIESIELADAASGSGSTTIPRLLSLAPGQVSEEALRHLVPEYEYFE